MRANTGCAPGDSGYRWILDRGKVMERDAEGRPLRMIGTHTDVTRRKQAEEDLRRNEERYQALIRTAMDGFWVADTGGRLVEVNDAYCAMSGYTRKQLLSMRIADLEDVENAAEAANHIRTVIERGWDRFETPPRARQRQRAERRSQRGLRRLQSYDACVRARYHRAEANPGQARAGPENGVDRQACGRYRARFQ